MDPRHPYLTEQLIAYIGNKRALLPFLGAVFEKLAEGRSDVSFADAFAGSGAVSRLARLMGFSVMANDWESYSFAINSCYLGVGASEAPSLFRNRGGLDSVLAALSALPPPRDTDRYISRHFAPARTRDADWRKERLFYTAENAATIDSTREEVERMYPGTPEDPAAFKEKMVLLGPLLYEAATHTNTSGVFKAYHHGFGGHGGDALGRIMSPIRLRPPVLVDSPADCRVFQQDAERFLSSHGADICYLDPPYAGHQYGSNYFMLNTIALWDKPPVSDERTSDGRFREKAGIRRDWTRTRSAFCSRATAQGALRRAAFAADCRYLCVSYSDEGLVSPEELADILSETGGLSVRATGYVKYPGGKQSMGRTIRNLELLFVVDRSSRVGSGGRGAGNGRGIAGGRGGGGGAEADGGHGPERGYAALENLLRDARLEKLMRSSFHPERIRKAFAAEGSAIVFGDGISVGGGSIAEGGDDEVEAAVASDGISCALLPMRHWYRFEDAALSAVRALGAAEVDGLMAALAPCRTADGREEIGVLVSILRAEKDPKARDQYEKAVLKLLRRFAHRKYREIFKQTVEELTAFSRAGLTGEAFRAGLSRVEETAKKRFGHGG